MKYVIVIYDLEIIRLHYAQETKKQKDFTLRYRYLFL